MRLVESFLITFVWKVCDLQTAVYLFISLPQTFRWVQYLHTYSKINYTQPIWMCKIGILLVYLTVLLYSWKYWISVAANIRTYFIRNIDLANISDLSNGHFSKALEGWLANWDVSSSLPPSSSPTISVSKHFTPIPLWTGQLVQKPFRRIDQIINFVGFSF